MGLLGEAVLAMWWDIPPEGASEFEDWHSHEHMPERLRIPGFLRGTRWADLSGRPSYFQRYEVQSFDTLSSAPYVERLNNPTPWSTKMFVHYFRNMTRSFCHIVGSFGSGLGHTMLTIRFSAEGGQERVLRAWLTQEVLPALAERSGMVGAHLLETEKHVRQPQTKEKELRRGDATADWILMATGYDSQVVTSLLTNELHEKTLVRHGASPSQAANTYHLAFALTHQDLEGPDGASH